MRNNMKKNFLTKLFAGMLGVTMIITTPAQTPLMSIAGENGYVVSAAEVQTGAVEIDIYTAEDLKELADNCHHEVYSVDKYVVLQNDISLEGSGFESIPIFSGVFNGNGHTISGYTYSGSGYVTGFFRYLTKTASVNGLTLSVDITASGDGDITGALAGINNGYVRKCVVEGSVNGITTTGGIIGINGMDALVLDCENRADVMGYYYTGGVCGRNYGVLRRCINSGNINSTPEWAASNDERQVDILSEITGDLSLVSYQSGVDTGGVCGFSRGIIMNSRNDATVGYERIGYNVGGICGRHYGTLYECANYGKVYGKKDVGGIVGQQEPYIEIDRAKSVSDAIAEINALSNMAVNDAADSVPEIMDAVRDLQQASGKAMDDAGAMTDDLSQYKLEEKDWASMIEAEAESAGRTAMDSLEAKEKEILDRLDTDRVDPDNFEIPENIPDELKEILENADPENLTEEQRQALEEAQKEEQRAKDEAEAEEAKAKEEAEREKREAEDQFNSTINGGISDWNNGIDTLSENSDILQSDLAGVRQASDNLLNLTSGVSNELTGDLLAINDRINSTYKLLEDLMNGVTDQGVKYLFSDISDRNPVCITDGRTLSCTNHGSIYGDINVGGIAGCLSVDTENLESNAIVKFELKTGEAYAISSLLYDNENDGLIETRTTAGGGVAGRCEHGCIRECRGYGAVGSADCEYTGGVVGSSDGTVIASYSLSTISGKGPTGGIAGYAASVRDCVAMPIFGNVDGKCGGVAGQILRDPDTESIDEADFSSNYYVAGGYYGIDDISYDGLAQAVDYDELLEMKGLPSDFANLKLTFVTNGEIFKVYPVNYGDTIENMILPEIPDSEGSYGVWPDLTGVKVTGNLVINAEYISHVAVLRSDSEYGETGKPLALVQGEFKTTDHLNAVVSDIGFDAPDGSAYTEVTVYGVSIAGNQDDLAGGCELRLYAPYEECRVWKKNGKVWEEVPCHIEGSYAQVTMDCSSATYAVTKTPDETMKYLGYAAIAVVSVLILFILIRQTLLTFRRKDKKGKKKA